MIRRSRVREPPRSTVEEGFLILADISGYTGYLIHGELDNAPEFVADLLETVIGHFDPILRLAKLEGDAAFVYATDSMVDGSGLVEIVEGAYFAFRRRVRDIEHASSCGCSACARMPDLDLKICVHHGRFVRQQVAGSEELTGPDVVLVHRLLKNRIREELAVDVYAAYSAAAVRAMDLDPDRLGWRRHVERYADVGEVEVWVGDLDRRWHDQQHERSVEDHDPSVAFEFVTVLPASPPVVWEHLTSPALREAWEGARVEQRLGTSGRRGEGTVTTCVHGRNSVLEEIVDWRPFERMTQQLVFPLVGRWSWTTELREVPGGTQVLVRAPLPSGGRRLVAWAMRRRILRDLETGMRRLADVLAP